MPNRTRAGKCINAVSAAANEFGMMKKGKAQKKHRASGWSGGGRAM